MALDCAARLAPYKHPAQILIVGSLPRGATGKLSKPLLRQQDIALTGSTTSA